MKDYVLSFIIGSCIFGYFIWVLSLLRLNINYYKFNPYLYFIALPITNGLLTAISLYLARLLNISKFLRLVLVSLSSWSVVVYIVYYKKIYRWKKDSIKPYIYPLINFAGNFTTFFIIIYLLESLFIKQ